MQMTRRVFLVATAGSALPVYGQFFAPAERPQPGTFEIGTRKELFVDDILIDQASGLSKIVARPEKFIDNPVIRPDCAWEPHPNEPGAHGIGIAGQSVLYDAEEKLFKMWYLCSGPKERSFWCYATSTDGLRWEKPELELFEYNGSKKNNILGVYADPQYFNIFKDPHDPDAAKRYKAMGELDGPIPNQSGGAYVGYSADGLRWTAYEGNPVIRHGPNLGDAPTLLGWDHLRKKYVCYPRPGHPLAPEIRGVGFHRHIRSLGYSESDDFLHWTSTKPMLMPGKNDRVDFQYERFLVGITGQFYIGLIPMRQSFDRTFEIFALSSRDGFHWNWLDHNRPFLERGEVGSYDGGGMACSGPIFHDGRVWIYYNGARYKHRTSVNNRPGSNDLSSISLAMLPTDRFVALVAGPHIGTLVTKPVNFSGSRLMVDMEGSVPVDLDRAEAAREKTFKRTFDDAEVRVGLFDQSGGALEGFSLDRCEPLFASGVQEVKWPGAELSTLRGKLVRVRFELRNAGLYSFQFAGHASENRN